MTSKDHTHASVADLDRILHGIARAIEDLANAEADHHAAMGRFLDHIGGAMRVDRVYIFENHEGADGAPAMSQRFEWSRDEVEPQIDNPELQALPYGTFPGWWEAFDRGRHLELQVPEIEDDDVRALLDEQSIVSLLLVPIMLRGSSWGFIGFDDCQRERRWRESEVAALQALAATVGNAIERHRAEAMLLEASAPVLQVWEGVLTLPIIGQLSRARAERLMESLLGEIQRQQARHVILDVTGMPSIGVEEADRLLRTVRAVGLLGARCTLVGIRPEVARTLVVTGAELGAIRTCATLQDGLADALASLNLAVQPRRGATTRHPTAAAPRRRGPQEPER